MMLKGFDISTIKEVGNKAIVKYSLYEGDYSTDADGNQVFNRLRTDNGSIVFNYYPVPDDDIKTALRQLCNEFSELEFAEGC